MEIKQRGIFPDLQKQKNSNNKKIKNEIFFIILLNAYKKKDKANLKNRGKVY